MRLQIYVPQMQADRWDPAPGFISWGEFQRRVADAAGGLYVTTAQGRWRGGAQEPVYVVEALFPTSYLPGDDLGARARTWATFREYAHQLLSQGEESVLIVQDSEPTLIRH